MNKKTCTLLESVAVKQLMRTYFNIAAPLFCCRPGSSRDALSDKLLHLILEVYDAHAYGPVCAQILRQTDAMETLTDGLLLNMDADSPLHSLGCYFDMKASALRLPELPAPISLDADLLPDVLRQSGALGLAWALRLGACLNWLEVDPLSSRENALRIWRMLSCAGDSFAMSALAYGLRTMGNTKAAETWKQAQALCDTVRSQFQVTVPSTLRAQAGPEAADLAQLLISTRSSLRESNGYLPLSMLQYAADSQDPLQQKLRHLCGSQATFQLRLLHEQQDEGKQYGF